MNVFAKFDEIPSMILQDIKETKRYGQTDARSFGRTDGQRENRIPSHKQSLWGYNKGADQLRGSASLFSHVQKAGFLTSRLK